MSSVGRLVVEPQTGEGSEVATIVIHAGDFLKGEYLFWGDALHLQITNNKGSTESFFLPTAQLESVEIASEENVRTLGGTIGWAAAGAVILGPVGLLAGLLAGGMKKEVTFVAKCKCGRKFLATTNSKTFTKLQAAVF
ncbi:MAG: hypothetical protein ACK2UO_13300 [Caldilineaceae bacterium]